MNRSILVCGATGFVGTHLMKRLADSGHRVVGATRRPDAARARHPDWAWTFADVEDKPSLQRAMEGHDTVVYLVHQMREDGNRLSAQRTSVCVSGQGCGRACGDSAGGVSWRSRTCGYAIHAPKGALGDWAYSA